ncbi:MAG: CPBP family intramembrane metalloprotease, partial [Rhizobacter sp.]|nr:CPBP family intramembrane metalloprotease [Chlorobiales bacterium]
LPQPVYQGVIERDGHSLVLVNIAVLAAVLVLFQGVGGVLTAVTIGLEITDKNVQAFRLMQSLAQYLFIAFPILFVTRLHTGDRSLFSVSNLDYLSLTAKPSSREILLAVLGVLVSYPLLSYLGNLQMILIESLPMLNRALEPLRPLKKIMEQLTAVNSFPEFVFLVFVVAITPALCEELMFRGYVQKNFSRTLSVASTVGLTGVIFGLFHIDPFNTLPLIALGIYMAFLRQTSESLWPSVAAHFANNFVSLVAIFILSHTKELGIGDKVASELNSTKPDISSPVAIVSALVSAAVLFGVIGLYRSESSRRLARTPRAAMSTH